MTADYRKPSEIEADIAAERARLSRDLETLQDRLTVDGLMDEVKLQVRAQIDDVTTELRHQFSAVSGDVVATVRDQIAVAGETVGRTARRNPWPFAVIGLGAAWLAISVVMPDRGPKVRKPRIGMAPIKPSTVSGQPHYDTSPADMAAARLEAEADVWAGTVAAESHPIPPYDPEPTWARDDESLTLTRP